MKRHGLQIVRYQNEVFSNSIVSNELIIFFSNRIHTSRDSDAQILIYLIE
jgi:hypothetical protein